MMDDLIKKLKEDLRQYVLSVTFTKANGDLRDMRCTLNPSFIHTNRDDFTYRSKNPKVKNDGIVAVWDLDWNAWRSFRIDSIKSVFAPATGKIYF